MPLNPKSADPRPPAFHSWLLPVGSALILILGILFVLIAAVPGFRSMRGGPLFTAIAVVTTLGTLGLVNLVAYRSYRGQDEVQRASLGFAAKWGAPVGQAAFVLLLLLPPFKAWATEVVGRFAGGGVAVNSHVVVVSMALAFCGVVLLQFIGTLAVGAVWWRSRL